MDRSRVLVRAQILGCKSCELSSSHTPVPFSGPSPNYWAVVGEAPGKVESAEGKPFIGPAGKYFRKTIDEIVGEGFADELSYVNAVSCWPERSLATPSAGERKACSGNLRAQVELIGPSFILVLGGVGVQAFYPSVGIKEMRGLWWKDPWIGAWCFATYHPSGVLRSGADSHRHSEWKSDLTHWWEVVQSRKIPPPRPECLRCGEAAEEYDGNGVGWCRRHNPTRNVVVKVDGKKPRQKAPQLQMELL